MDINFLKKLIYELGYLMPWENCRLHICAPLKVDVSLISCALHKCNLSLKTESVI